MSIQAAWAELTELAKALRPDWNPDQFEGAVQAARTAGWSWERIFKFVFMLLLDEDATPRELVLACSDPRRGGRPAEPAVIAASMTTMRREAAAAEMERHARGNEKGEVA